ncbi:MAG: LbtU family siderophore porin [Pseudomonadota bacterium]
MKKMIVTMMVSLLMTTLIIQQTVAEESTSFSVLSATENVTLSGTVEVEAGFASDYADTDTGEISLATVEFGVDAEINDWTKGHVLFSWDDGVDVDEGFITLGGTETFPVYLTAGLLYVPFGVYETNMISDPLTLEIGETREHAVQAGAEMKGFYGSLYLFNGDVQDDTGSEDDTVETFGATAGYAIEKENFSLDVGAGYISNIMDSDGLGDGFEEDEAAFVETNPGGAYALKDYVAGFGAHVIIRVGPVRMIGEYINALDDPEYLADDGAGTTTVIKTETPSAFHIECAYTFEIKEKEITLAGTYQATDNLGGMHPETRYGAVAGIGLSENLELAAEFLHDEDYDAVEGGTGESADSVTMQLALTF